MTVGVEAVNRFDLVESLLQAVKADPQLRASLPVGIDVADSDALAPHLEATVKQLVETLSGVDADVVARRLGRAMNDATRPAPVRPLETVALADGLDPAQQVRWRPSLKATVSPHDAGTISITTRTAPVKTLTLPAACEPTIRSLIDGHVHRIDELPDLPTDDALVVVRRLLREGFVVAADA